MVHKHTEACRDRLQQALIKDLEDRIAEAGAEERGEQEEHGGMLR